MSTPAPPAGLLLAAGAGTRMGRPKALVRFRGGLLAERGAALLRDGGCRPVVVVLGASAHEVWTTADLSDVEVAVAQDWQRGMATSLRCGLSCLEGSAAQGVVVALVDQPLVGPEAVQRLVQAWWRHRPEAVAASYGGEVRNPVLLDRRIWGEVGVVARGDTGARSWLRANPDRVLAVPCDGTGQPADADTPEELAALQDSAD